MNRLKVFLMMFLCTVALEAVSAEKKQAAYRVYLGTMSRQSGIYNSILNPETGKLSKPKLVAKVTLSGIIKINPGGTVLYTTGRPGHSRGWGGSLCAFKIDRTSGKLKLLNSQLTKGIGPCDIALDPKQHYLFVPHFRGGTCSVLPLAKDGSLKPATSEVRHSGSGRNKMRQSSPHPHAAVFDPAGQHVYVPDLGLDKIYIYKINNSGKITANKTPYVKVESGGGPRHFIFHPSGKFAYTNLELTSKISAFKYDPRSGSLKAIQTISTLPDSYIGMNANAGLRVTPDGQFLYVSNRGHNSIAGFSIAPVTGKLTFTGSTSTHGDVPQTINIDPSGNFIISTDKRSGSVRVFRIDPKSGLLSQTDRVKLPNAGSIDFLPVD